MARFPSGGTVNALYRLGESLAVRLPLVAGGTADVALEREWLPRLAPTCPYYRDTNPTMAHNARQVLRAVLHEQ